MRIGVSRRDLCRLDLACEIAISARGARSRGWRFQSRFHCAPGGDNSLQNGGKYLPNEMRGLEESFGAKGLTVCEVNPCSETVCVLTVRRWLKISIHFVGSAPEWLSVGEAETGSGGDQPVKE